MAEGLPDQSQPTGVTLHLVQKLVSLHLVRRVQVDVSLRDRCILELHEGGFVHLASLRWVIVIFGEIERSRGILRYYKILCPLNSRH
jgi:hypothetical protein